MKKKYLKPAVETIVLKGGPSLMAGSDNFKVNNDAAPVNPEDTW